MCVDYQALDNFLPPVVKVHSKAQGVLSLVSLPKIDELYVMLNSATVYSSLDCISGYDHTGLSPEVFKKSAFVTPF